MGYVFWRPISSILAIVLDKTGLFEADSWAYGNAWVYMAIFNNFIQVKKKLIPLCYIIKTILQLLDKLSTYGSAKEKV